MRSSSPTAACNPAIVAASIACGFNPLRVQSPATHSPPIGVSNRACGRMGKSLVSAEKNRFSAWHAR